MGPKLAASSTGVPRHGGNVPGRHGYGFKPWTRAPIATADEIRSYMGEVIRDSGIAPRIRYGHVIRSASWEKGRP